MTKRGCAPPSPFCHALTLNLSSDLDATSSNPGQTAAPLAPATDCNVQLVKTPTANDSKSPPITHMTQGRPSTAMCSVSSTGGHLATSQQTNFVTSKANASTVSSSTPLQQPPSSTSTTGAAGLRRSSRLYNGSNTLKVRLVSISFELLCCLKLKLVFPKSTCRVRAQNCLFLEIYF